MYNTWHNWAALLEVASHLIKQMIHLQLVKVLQLRKEVKRAFSWLPAQWWTHRDGCGSNLPSTAGLLAAASPPRFAWGTFWQQHKALQPGSAQPDTTESRWMEMEKTRTSSGLRASRLWPIYALDQLSHVSPHPSPASLLTQTHDPSFPTVHKHLPFTNLSGANCIEVSCCFTRKQPWSLKFFCSGCKRGQKSKVLVVSSSPPNHILLMVDAVSLLVDRIYLLENPMEACGLYQRCCLAE